MTDKISHKKHSTYTQEDINEIKYYVIEKIQDGDIYVDVLKSIDVSPAKLKKWRKDDVKFDKDLVVAFANNKKDKITIMKRRVLQSLYRNNGFVSIASKEMLIGQRQIWSWIATDSEFKKDYDKCKEDLRPSIAEKVMQSNLDSLGTKGYAGLNIFMSKHYLGLTDDKIETANKNNEDRINVIFEKGESEYDKISSASKTGKDILKVGKDVD